MTPSSAARTMKPPTNVLFSSDLWEPALAKYAAATHVTVKLFDTDLRIVFGPIHSTPLFELFDRGGYDPGLFAECARQCLEQTTERPAVTVSKIHGLAVVGTSLVLDGKVVGAAVAGYVLVDFSQLSEIERVAKDARLESARLWQVAREQSPVSQQRLTLNGDLLQALGDALLRENSRTREYEHIAQELRETARAKKQVHHKLLETASVLRESEERYRTLFDLGPIAVYSCDASGVIRDFNRRAVELWGRKPNPGDSNERWCGSFKMHRPDGVFLPHGECPMAEVLSGKIPEARDAELQIERPDGSRITVIVNIRLLKNDRGEMLGAINCFVDITERKHTEEVSARLAAIVEFSDDAMISKTFDGTITSWNKGAERLFGYTAGEAIGKNITLIVPSDRLPEEDEFLERLKQGERVERFETVRKRKDGSLFDVSLTISPLKDSSGRIVGASKVARDITEKKVVEKALQQAHDHLELLVEQRTATVRKLSSEMIRSQDEERRRIARELHDSVGQQLVYAKMSLEGLKKNITTDKGAAALGHVAETLDKCLTETRTISHLLHPPLLDEVGFISAASWFAESFSERSGIQVNLDIPKELGRLPSVVELVLFRILQESLTNVHRHAHAHTVDIQVHAGAREVSLDVHDNGSGISPELLKQVRTNGGGGVGLNSIRERLRELDGRLEIQSDTGGTLIRVSIPISDKQAAQIP